MAVDAFIYFEEQAGMLAVEPTDQATGFWDWRKEVQDGTDRSIDGSIDALAVDPTNPNTGDDSKPDVLVGVSGRDWTFDSQSELTTEPTAPEAGGTDGKGYVLTSIQHSATDTSLVDQPDTEASSRLFVGNLTLDSQASVQTGFGGGVVVASGDVNGDNSALGDPITFTYTVRNTSSAYEGTHALYQDVVIPSVDTGPALAIEEVTIAHEGYWL